MKLRDWALALRVHAALLEVQLKTLDALRLLQETQQLLREIETYVKLPWRRND